MVQDLSRLAEDSMWVTSQAGGNMMSGRPKAMSAPGSVPVNPLPAASEQDEPNVEMGPVIPVGDTGRPEPSHSLPSGTASWTRTATAGPGRAPAPSG
jgi:hypothetical protein